jgi:hypothetical protein
LPAADAPKKPRSLVLGLIQNMVIEFLHLASSSPDWAFIITPIGCGTNGFKPEEIAPMFRDAPKNCLLPTEFRKILNAEV